MLMYCIEIISDGFLMRLSKESTNILKGIIALCKNDKKVNYFAQFDDFHDISSKWYWFYFSTLVI